MIKQPAKAAQTDPGAAKWREAELQADLERVNEQLAVAQSQIDNNDATLAQVKLCHKRELERVKGQLDEALKRELVLTVHCNAVEHQRDELLAALRLLLRYAETPVQPPSESALRQANSAIAAAEGRAS